MNMKRMRGRNHRSGGSSSGGGSGSGGSPRHLNGNIPLNRNHVFDSSGPDVRVRGTAQQLFEKYQQLGRDATSSGDRVTAEGFYQHAEHYFRILNVMNQAAQQNPQAGGGAGDRGDRTGGGQYQRRGEQGGQDGGSDGLQGEAGEGDVIEEAIVERKNQPSAMAPGMGDQPSFELREIPIAAEPSVDA